MAAETSCYGGFSRRKFIERLGLASAAGGFGGVGLPRFAWADGGDAGPVDCGPPPPAKPHHQTGGESFPPLPLPATPLRRSEKKRPPSPPALVGKMAMGATRWITKDGKRVQYRDWMTDPADVITLLELDRRQAGHPLSGGRDRVRPFLLRSAGVAGAACWPGTTSSSLTDEVRAKLARYVHGRRHDHRRRLLRLERFRRELPPRDRVDLSRPAAAEDAARGAGLRVVLQAGQSDVQEGRRLDLQRAALPGGDRLRLPGGRDLLAARLDLRLGRPRAPPRHARGDRRGPASRGQHDHLYPRHVPAWPVPEHDEGLSRGDRPDAATISSSPS